MTLLGHLTDWRRWSLLSKTYFDVIILSGTGSVYFLNRLDLSVGWQAGEGLAGGLWCSAGLAGRQVQRKHVSKHLYSNNPDSIPPSDRRWLLVAWSADFADVGPTLGRRWLPNQHSG